VLSCKFIAEFQLSFNKKILLESIKISYPLTPRIFFGVIDTQINKYLIGLLASLGGAGIYKIGEQVSMLVFKFMTHLENVFIPQTYKNMFNLGEKGGEVIGRYLTPFAYLSILLALFISLFSEEIVLVLTPESYHGAIDIIIILSMFYGCSFIGKITGTQLIFKKKTYVASILTLLSIVINVGLSIPFIMKWGAIGAAWATFLSGIIYRTVGFCWAQRSYKVKWEYEKIAVIFLLFFASSILMISLRAVNMDYIIRMAIKLIIIFTYGYIGVRIRVITTENFLLVKDTFTKFSLRKV